MKLLNNKNKGFTLTELIIVIVIIGILAGVLIPSLTSYVNKAKVSAAEQDALSIYKEYLAKVDADTEETLFTSNYVVYVKDYYIIIEKGSLKSSNNVNTVVSEFGTYTTPESTFTKTSLPNNVKYFIIEAESKTLDLAHYYAN